MVRTPHGIIADYEQSHDGERPLRISEDYTAKPQRTFQQVAAIIGVSKRQVQNDHDRAIRKLRAALSSREPRRGM